MLKNNELRIGNLVKWYDVSTVLELHSEKNKFDNVYIECEESFELTEYNKLEPIPLTEEWLFKFGFVKKLANYELENFRFHINKPFNYDGFLFCEGYSVVTDRIKYVHQLQNLYFALTGAELTVA